MVIGLWIAVRLVLRTTGNRSRGMGILVGLVGIACELAPLPNPYSIDLVEFLLRTAIVPRREISEWTPLGS